MRSCFLPFACNINVLAIRIARLGSCLSHALRGVVRGPRKGVFLSKLLILPSAPQTITLQHIIWTIDFGRRNVKNTSHKLSRNYFWAP